MCDPLPSCDPDMDCELIQKQAERRMRNRMEFLRKRTDPCKQMAESGYVFDPALQRYHSMKSTQTQYFRPGVNNALFTLCSLAPMFLLGALIYWQRDEKEQHIRCGRLRYRDRWFKMA